MEYIIEGVGCGTGFGEFSAECVYKSFCEQYRHHLFKWGIICLIAYFTLIFLSKWFIFKGYKHVSKTDNPVSKWLRNLDDLDKAQNIYNNLWNALQMLLISYVVIVIWLNR